jgi:hypothetical protein
MRNPSTPGGLPGDDVAAVERQREKAQALLGGEIPAEDLSRRDAKARRSDRRGTIQLRRRVNRRPARIEDLDENVGAGAEIRRGNGLAADDSWRLVQRGNGLAGPTAQGVVLVGRRAVSQERVQKGAEQD